MASTSKFQTAPSTLSESPRQYEVFLSFRGDTRYYFTDHLYEALVDQGIVTFRDEEQLETGEPISPELMSAIENSRIAVVVLSKDYASSTWCLQELANIVECKKEREMRIFPIFYHVDPSDVRKQKGTFAVAFAEHEKRFKENIEMVQGWRDALKEVADLKGLHLEGFRQYEGKFIRSIVFDIRSKLNDHTAVSVNKDDIASGLVGIESRVEELKCCIDIEASSYVRFIGICGMSGIGKTTLARVVFDRLHYKFEGSSFLKNVGDVAKRNGIHALQEQLLSDLKLKRKTDEWNQSGIENATRNRLHKRRVFIVLDDVTEEEQLENLAGNPNWFGPGSRIIITTEDNHLLTLHGVQQIYKAKKLNASDALHLFCLKALGKPHCHEEDLLDLCNQFVRYAGGLPLSLKVLGSSLFHREKKVWEDALDKLKENPDSKFWGALEVSFEGLEDSEKRLFLDIACFFNGEARDRVVDLLDGAAGFYPNMDIKNLADKSLIIIFGENIWIHNLLQQMAMRIVRRESAPEKRSRLWDWDDVLQVQKYTTGTELATEGVVLNSPPHREQLNARAFSKMEKLRLLKISDVHLPQGLADLPNNLRLLDWYEYPLKSLPRSFQASNLVELIMRRSCLKHLPEEFCSLSKLKLIDLSDSQNLIMTPNISGVPNLERLILKGCTRLQELHPSIGDLKRLTLLSLRDCKSLFRLPLEINLESLEIFVLSGCSRVRKLPEIGKTMTSLSELYLDGTAIEEIPSSIEHLTGLTLLNLGDCKNLSSFPRAIGGLKSLKSLILSGCEGQPPKSADSIGLIPMLSAICATICSWTDFFLIAHHPINPEPINLSLPMSFSGLISLVSLDLSDCNLFDGTLPDDLSCLSSLQSLNLGKNNFTRLPNSISQLSKLIFLCLDGCSRLQSLPNLPLSVQLVMARGCTSLENYSNRVIVWTSGAAGFTFIDCLSLAHDGEDLNASEMMANNEDYCDASKISLLDIHYQPLWQRYMEEQIYQSEIFHSVSPQTEIPEWFSHQKTGSFVPILLPSDLYENSSWRGLSLCSVFEVHENLNNVSPGQDLNYFHEFICRLDVDGGLLDSSLIFTVPWHKLSTGSFGLWVYISHARFRDQLDVRSCITPSITSSSPDIVIRRCGARIMYEQDTVEFVKHLSHSIFGSPDDLHRGFQEFQEKHKVLPQRLGEAESCESIGEGDSNSRLKRDLKSLLSTLYQGHAARNHLYDYIFPQIAIPSWFSYQNFASHVRMELPQNLHEDITWTGYSVYAFYKIHNWQPAVSADNQDSAIFVRFGALSACDEGPTSPYIAFPLSRDIFADSLHRLLVFYIPRVIFQSNRSDHIWASFHSTNSNVKVEMSGIRLVYEKDVEEFVQTLVQCMLGCPDEYHPHYYRGLLDSVGMLQGCEHGEDCSYPSLRRGTQPMPQLLPSIENSRAEETLSSPETFPYQALAAGTNSRNSSRSYISLGIPFDNGHSGSSTSRSILESWVSTFLQGFYNIGGVFNHCFPQREIPEWFPPHQRGGLSVKIPLSPSPYNDPDWMGFAICAVFSFHKHPTAVRMNLDSKTRHSLMCHLQTNLGPVSPIFYSSITEDGVLISLCQRAFIWVSFIPSKLLTPHWSRCTWVRFSFLSDSPDVSPIKCGVRLVYNGNMDEFARTMVQLITSYVDYVYAIRSSCEEEIHARLPIYHDRKTGTDSSYQDPDSQARLPISQEEITTRRAARNSYEDPPTNHFYRTGALDFHPSTYYNFCFPPTNIGELFSHQSNGLSVTIDVPPNLYEDNNWMGFALYASFSFCGHPGTLIENLKSDISHFLYCQFRTSEAGLDDEILSCYTSREEIMWLLNLGGFIWISYIPGEPLKGILRQPSQVEASIVSDWPGMMVEKCALRLFYEHDEMLFRQKLIHLDALISEYRDSVNQFMDEQEADDEIGLGRTTLSNDHFRIEVLTRFAHQAETNETRKRQRESELLDFDGCSIWNLCCPPKEILNWFSHQSKEPSVAADIPKSMCQDSDWMGLFLCAYFSVNKSPTTNLGNPDSAISHHLICHLQPDVASQEPLLHIHRTSKEEFMWLYTKGGFIWLFYIPLGSFPDWSNKSSSMEASIISDWPGLIVQKCGLRFFHARVDQEEFEQLVFRCRLVSENRDFLPPLAVGKKERIEKKLNDEARPRASSGIRDLHFKTKRTVHQGQSSGSKTQICKKGPHDLKNQCFQIELPVFDRSLIYNSCFPPSEILEWFSRRSSDPLVTISLPPNLYDDATWMGVALCASFSVLENSTTAVDNLYSQVRHNLTCHLEADTTGCPLELHSYCLGKEDLMFLRLGGFIWLSYIPRLWFPKDLNGCRGIDATIFTDCPGLTVEKCGFRLLFQNDETEFVVTIKHCMASFSNNWDAIHQLLIDNEKTIEPHAHLWDEAKPRTTSSRSDGDSHNSKEVRGSINPPLKDKGKRIVEEPH